MYLLYIIPYYLKHKTIEATFFCLICKDRTTFHFTMVQLINFNQLTQFLQPIDYSARVEAG